jgi:hypothetical protein
MDFQLVAAVLAPRASVHMPFVALVPVPAPEQLAGILATFEGFGRVPVTHRTQVLRGKATEFGVARLPLEQVATVRGGAEPRDGLSVPVDLDEPNVEGVASYRERLADVYTALLADVGRQTAGRVTVRRALCG